MRSGRFALLVVAVFVTSFPAAATAEEHENLTGLERAAQATLQGLEKSQGRAAEAPGRENRARGLDEQKDKVTGRERAAAAIAAALARGNGAGNAFGRGHAADVLGILLGELPGELNEANHGQAVREMVHAYNAIRKATTGG